MERFHNKQLETRFLDNHKNLKKKLRKLILYPEKQTPALLARCDVNGDGAVSAFDAVILLRRIMDYQEL